MQNTNKRVDRRVRVLRARKRLRNGQVLGKMIGDSLHRRNHIPTYVHPVVVPCPGDGVDEQLRDLGQPTEVQLAESSLAH